jgi:hypothetical protein
MSRVKCYIIRCPVLFPVSYFRHRGMRQVHFAEDAGRVVVVVQWKFWESLPPHLRSDILLCLRK